LIKFIYPYLFANLATCSANSNISLYSSPNRSSSEFLRTNPTDTSVTSHLDIFSQLVLDKEPEHNS